MLNTLEKFGLTIDPNDIKYAVLKQHYRTWGAVGAFNSYDKPRPFLTFDKETGLYSLPEFYPAFLDMIYDPDSDPEIGALCVLIPVGVEGLAAFDDREGSYGRFDKTEFVDGLHLPAYSYGSSPESLERYNDPIIQSQVYIPGFYRDAVIDRGYAMQKGGAHNFEITTRNPNRYKFLENLVLRNGEQY